MAAVKTYNPKDCVITVGGVYITGLGEDMVKCEKDEDNFTTKVGAQGDVVVNQSCNDLGTITISVQGTSPQKSFFQLLHHHIIFICIFIWKFHIKCTKMLL